MAVDAANLRAHADQLSFWGAPLAMPGAITALLEALDLLDTLTASVTDAHTALMAEASADAELTTVTTPTD